MEQSMLFIIVRTQDGVNLDPLPFTSYNAAYAKFKELYEEEVVSGGEFFREDTVLQEWSFTVAYHSGWLQANIMQVPNPGLFFLTAAFSMRQARMILTIPASKSVFLIKIWSRTMAAPALCGWSTTRPAKTSPIISACEYSRGTRTAPTDMTTKASRYSNSVTTPARF